MFEHPSYTYSVIVADQQLVDRANELRLAVAEHPEQVVPRAHPFRDRVRGWFHARRADAATPMPDRPAHAR
ncbi:hypothetical protein [Microbacterium sp.]|uniref:hypothetical protein n=1 Tax=Microbacterium sp. TaxID=51671 RepID=UPI003F946240